MFVTLFIDLVGFSIIFPLFPNMLEFYMGHESTTGLFGALVGGIDRFSAYAGGTGYDGRLVLFGGVLGSVYSLLQFACAPTIGNLSDRYGRRPVLLVSIAGLACSYVMWFFAHSFAVLVVARIIGGIMSGNISTASAVAADVTTPRTRSKGMAVIGIAFGVGFIVGPAIGGISSKLDLTAYWPALEAYGVNPFSFPALLAFLFTVFNLALVAARYPETLPKERRGTSDTVRIANPFRLFHTEAYPGVTLTNVAWFLFILAFSGMEFSLTFVGRERFHNTPTQNAYMLLFIGIVLAVIQGKYVHPKSDVRGVKRMSLEGLACVMPGLAIVGYAKSLPVLYVGLFLMAAGSAMVMPCMTALASLYTPLDEQGRVLGVFRSLGALGRGLGPLFACAMYWQLGSAITYYLVAAFLIAPLLVASRLPKPIDHEHGALDPAEV
ncbi:MAG: MFS transporter [Candidatus Hydrogenedentes bacterium]|nr:MFS transporter [Candidatus Hydrogenedentota bacterium]